ncbi:hypothetical protein GCK72_026108 [Caenorhabditis remanei]|uniref:F-box domain-containing protein n=1 Tax=Caenorhabditis remanei TaxID=31234 RepID=A0A6A5G3Y7_CAERE|nr:hypothetical protein GCK72_026108 [Caenorhabditis remanei]KAF1749640.1 hypothetical protein GCK72_026108 [Caenorhabditis remanei]
MEFLKFPFLAQKVIIHQMDLDDVFLVSLTNLRVFDVIRRVPWKHVKAISYKNRRTHTSVLAVKSQADLTKVLEIRPSKRSSREILHLTASSGFNMTYNLPTDSEALTILFNDHGVNETSLFVHEHLGKLFGKHLQFGCILTSYDMIFLPAVVPITSNVLILHYNVDPEELNGHVANMNEQEYLTISNKMTLLPKNHQKYMTSKSLYFINTGSLAPDILQRFEGQDVVLLEAKCKVRHVIAFVDSWKKGNSSNNLKSLRIQLDSALSFRPETVSNFLKFKHFSVSRDPPRFCRTVRKYFGAEETLEEHDLTISTYVVRDTDKRVASISISEDRFDFCVWNWNERQMMEQGFIDHDTS